jgi:hypothetical protein
MFAAVEGISMLKVRSHGSSPLEVPFSVGTFAYEVYEQVDCAAL